MFLKNFIRLSFCLFVVLVSMAGQALAASAYSLTVSVSVGGQVSSPHLSGFTCIENTCKTVVPAGATIKFVPTELSSYRFKNWDGACTGTDDTACTVQVNSDTSLYAYFRPVERTLKTAVSTGGSVVSLAANINCTEQTCYERFLLDTELTLSALPLRGYTFTGWSGSCSGTASDCRITLDAYKAVGAHFAPITSSTPSSVQLQWTLPTKREDGTALAAKDIKQHVIYYGKSSGVYSGSITVSAGADGLVPQSLAIQGLESGLVYYFAGITVDMNGLPSKFSTEISRMIE